MLKISAIIYTLLLRLMKICVNSDFTLIQFFCNLFLPQFIIKHTNKCLNQQYTSLCICAFLFVCCYFFQSLFILLWINHSIASKNMIFAWLHIDIILSKMKKEKQCLKKTVPTNWLGSRILLHEQTNQNKKKDKKKLVQSHTPKVNKKVAKKPPLQKPNIPSTHQTNQNNSLFGWNTYFRFTSNYNQTIRIIFVRPK